MCNFPSGYHAAYTPSVIDLFSGSLGITQSKLSDALGQLQTDRPGDADQLAVVE